MSARRNFEETQGTRGVCKSVVALWLALIVVIGCGPACAESTSIEAAGSRAAATARLDFKIVIPQVLRLNASTGTFFTNGRRAETVVVATSDGDFHRSIATPIDPSSVRAAINALTRAAARPAAGYTVAMP
jgi:hypothetical protein